MTCADCGVTVTRRSPSQRYCDVCSGVRDDVRKRAWANANPRAEHGTKDQRDASVSRMRAAGAARSDENRSNLAWLADHEYVPHTQVRVAVPFDWAFSKNAVWRYGRGGHVYARKESNSVRDGLAAALRPHKDAFLPGKVWVDIFVEKPNHKGDATNVVDVVCDAIKDAIEIDDRWYSIRKLDWAIVKNNPRILVGVSQDVEVAQQICSHCGRSLELEHDFGLNRSTKTGYARVCKDCAAPIRGRRAA